MGNKQTPQFGQDAYTIKLDESNLIASGNYADVYKIQKEDTKIVYAAKFIKAPPKFIQTLERLGYDREFEILKEINHPFIIKF